VDGQPPAPTSAPKTAGRWDANSNHVRELLWKEKSNGIAIQSEQSAAQAAPAERGGGEDGLLVTFDSDAPDSKRSGCSWHRRLRPPAVRRGGSARRCWLWRGRSIISRRKFWDTGDGRDGGGLIDTLLGRSFDRTGAPRRTAKSTRRLKGARSYSIPRRTVSRRADRGRGKTAQSPRTIKAHPDAKVRRRSCGATAVGDGPGAGIAAPERKSRENSRFPIAFRKREPGERRAGHRCGERAPGVDLVADHYRSAYGRVGASAAFDGARDWKQAALPGRA